MSDEYGLTDVLFLKDQTEENMRDWITRLNQSGYAGCLPNGWIVDRREYPKAIPVRENSIFGVVAPKEVKCPNCGEVYGYCEDDCYYEYKYYKNEKYKNT